MSPAPTSLRHLCQSVGHEYLLEHWERLSPQQQSGLEKQIRDLDFEQIARVWSEAETHIDWNALALQAEPPQSVRLGESYRGIS
ncbi:MAG: hypothetical protein WCI02_10735, partial [Planctomycetota bacterium]